MSVQRLPVSENEKDNEPIPRHSRVLSRIIDLFCSIIGLLLLLPIFAIVGAAIKLQDGGPVFYRQVRVGRDFQPFRLYKFRSMVANADRDGLLTSPGDSRVTAVGMFLRQHKLDELPQLLNVLKGDMQLVGARPEVEQYVSMFQPEYARILREPPGITDPASLAYMNEERLFLPGRVEEQYVQEILPAKLKLSVAYQESRTVSSDLRLLLRTVIGLGM